MDEITREVLTGIYRHLRQMQKSQFEVQKMASAMRLALKEVPGFEQRYGAHWAEQSDQIDGQHEQVLRDIDAIIEKL
jgi:hypothetical protein